jgi:curved DNA-binding protein CbpA
VAEPTDNQMDPSLAPDIAHALQVLGLTAPVTRERLEQKRQELLGTWHPHRYANLTNNPRKYMQMYKKGEAMTKEINAAYELLTAWLANAKKPTARG